MLEFAAIDLEPKRDVVENFLLSFFFLSVLLLFDSHKRLSLDLGFLLLHFLEEYDDIDLLIIDAASVHLSNSAQDSDPLVAICLISRI